MKIHDMNRFWLVLPKMPNGRKGLHSDIVAKASVPGELHPSGLCTPVFHTSGSPRWGEGACHTPFILCSLYHGCILILYKPMHEQVTHMYTVCIWQAVVKHKSLVCVFETSVHSVPLTLWCIKELFECLLMLCFVLWNPMGKFDL